MPTNEVLEAQNFIVKQWGESGRRVVLETRKASDYFGITLTEFIDHCTTCGNTVETFLSGIHELWPNVWHEIPYNMGRFPFRCLCHILTLCGVDTSN